MKTNELLLSEIRQMLNMMGIDEKKIKLVESNLLSVNKKNNLILEETIYQKIIKFLTPGNPVGFVRRLVGNQNLVDFFGENIDEVDYNKIMTAIRNADLDNLEESLLKKLTKNLRTKAEFAEVLEELYKDEISLLQQAGVNEIALFRKIKNQMAKDPNLTFDDAFYLAVNGGQRKFFYEGLKDVAITRFKEWEKSLIKGSTKKFEPVTVRPTSKVPKEIIIKGGKTEEESIQIFQDWLNKTYPGIWNRTSDGTVFELDKNAGKASGYGEWTTHTKEAWSNPSVKKAYIAEMKKNNLGNVLYESEKEIRNFKKWLYDTGKITKEEYDEMIADGVSGVKTEKTDALWEQFKLKYHKHNGYYANVRMAARNVSMGEILRDPIAKKWYKLLGQYIANPARRKRWFGIVRPLLFLVWKGMGRNIRGTQDTIQEIIEKTLYAVKQNATNFKVFEDAADAIALQILALRRSEALAMKDFVDKLKATMLQEFPDDAEGIESFFNYLQTEGKSYYAELLNTNTNKGGLWGFMEDTSLGRDWIKIKSIYKNQNLGNKWSELAVESLRILFQRAIMLGLTGRLKTFKEYLDELLKEGVINTFKIGGKNTYIPNLSKGLPGIIIWAGVMQFAVIPYAVGIAQGSVKGTEGMVTKLNEHEKELTVPEYAKNYVAESNSKAWNSAVEKFEQGEIGKAIYELSPFKIELVSLINWFSGGLNGTIYQENLNKIKNVFYQDMLETQKFTETEIATMWQEIEKTGGFNTIGEFAQMITKLRGMYKSAMFKDTLEGFKEYLEYNNLKIGSDETTPTKDAYYKTDGGTYGKDTENTVHVFVEKLGRWMPRTDIDTNIQRWKELYKQWYPQNISNAEDAYSKKNWIKAKTYYEMALKNIVPFSQDAEELKDAEEKQSYVKEWINNCNHNSYIDEGMRYLKTGKKDFALNQFREALRYPLKIYNNGTWTVDQDEINSINKKIESITK